MNCIKKCLQRNVLLYILIIYTVNRDDIYKQFTFNLIRFFRYPPTAIIHWRLETLACVCHLDDILRMYVIYSRLLWCYDLMEIVCMLCWQLTLSVFVVHFVTSSKINNTSICLHHGIGLNTCNTCKAWIYGGFDRESLKSHPFDVNYVKYWIINLRTNNKVAISKSFAWTRCEINWRVYGVRNIWINEIMENTNKHVFRQVNT